jgi:two-component sensor histidine kinase
LKAGAYEERAMREQTEIDYLRAIRFKDALIVETNHRTKNTLANGAAAEAISAPANQSTREPTCSSDDLPD